MNYELFKTLKCCIKYFTDAILVSRIWNIQTVCKSHWRGYTEKMKT